MTETLLVFATLLEAVPFLEGATEIYPNFYQTPVGDLLIVGMGPHLVRERMEPYKGKYSAIWNIGYAGGLSKKVSFGEVYTINLVGKEELTCQLEDEGQRLITVDQPLHDPVIRDELSAHWDLVDMEGFHIASVAAVWGIPCRLVKVVSDNANQETSKTIRENAPFLSAKLFSKISCL